MKIGILSAPKHCKTHIRSLRGEGYDIHCLGDDPKSIPPSYDVVVVRVASSSHQGVAVARDWSRETGKPSLYENGLSGIRTALKGLSPSGDTDPVGEAAPALTLETARRLVRQWGDALYEARPDETAATMQKHLKATLRREHPTHYSLWAPLIPAICVDILGPGCLAPVVEPPVEETSLMPSEHVYPTHQSTASWGRVYTPQKLQRAVETAQRLRDELGEELVGAFRDAYMRCEADPSVELWKWASRQPSYLKRGAKRTIFCGKPMVYVAFVYSLFNEERPSLVKRTFYTTYRSLTGKGADSRIPDAVAWYLGFPPPKESKPYHKAMESRAKKKAAAKKTPPAVGGGKGLPANGKTSPLSMLGNHSEPSGRVQADLDENTRAICALMDEVKTLRDQHSGELAALRSEMEALRRQEPGGSAPVDPFVALDEVKGRLAALGFKGTLTLTVE